MSEHLFTTTGLATRAWPEVRDEARLVDYGSYDAAVAAARAGADPYDPAMLLRHRRAPEPRVLSAYQYPPTFLVAMGWTAAVTPAEGARVWFWVNEVALLVAAAALAALGRDLATAAAAALTLAALGAIPDHLRVGQANALTVAPLALALVALARGRERLAGLGLAAAVAVKLLPLVVLAGVRMLNPAYLAIFDGAAGQLVLVGCALSTAVGYTAMLWLTRLPGEERVLR